MKDIRFAPMEGVGLYVFRNAFHRHYHGISRYYAPFLEVNSDGDIKRRNLNDILPENNPEISLVPQVLTARVNEFCSAARKVKDLGYKELNINMGCPYGTVVSKGKGAALLSDPERLRGFLDGIFSSPCGEGLQISVKMRIGMKDPEEGPPLAELLSDYPLKELIIHPRLQKDFYTGPVHEDILADMIRLSRIPVCVNPGIVSPEDYFNAVRQFSLKKAPESFDPGVMIGRGLLYCPELAERITEQKSPLRQSSDSGLSLSSNSGQGSASVHGSASGQNSASAQSTASGESIISGRIYNSAQDLQAVPKNENRSAQADIILPDIELTDAYLPGVCSILDLKRFQLFHDDLVEGYQRLMCGETPVLHKLKELWNYWSIGLNADHKTLKKIKKASSLRAYQEAVGEILSL